MPYGFIKHMEYKGYSPETVTSYEKVLTQLFQYLNSVYPDKKEAFQISSRDIREYLYNQIERKKSISTINKELAIIKTFFNYLWEIDKVPVDPAVKIRRYKTNKKRLLEITFNELELLLNKVLCNSDYSAMRKAIYILALKGLKSSEFRFKKEQVISLDDDSVEIKLQNRSIILKGEISTYFLEYFYQSLFNDTDYVFVSKIKGKEEKSPIQVMTILNHLRAISYDYLAHKSSLTLVKFRKAIAYELYQKKKYPIQLIAKELGIEENTASNYLKTIVKNNTD